MKDDQIQRNKITKNVGIFVVPFQIRSKCTITHMAAFYNRDRLPLVVPV